MPLLVFGISHKTAALAVREKVSFDQSRAETLLQDLIADTTATQALVLSTCNRTEIYCDAMTADGLISVLLRHCSLDEQALLSACYQYHGQLAIEHLMKVACGLDSMVIGEAEILGQVKKAFALSEQLDVLGAELRYLSQEVFKLAKHIRTTSEVGACPVSVASIAARKALAEFGDLSQANILLLGAGDTIQLLAKYLQKQKLGAVTIASRKLENARKLSDAYNAKAVALTDVHDCLVDIDIVFAATNSQLPLIGKGAVESALKQRPQRPMLLIDMAVPRDIEMEVAELDNAKLYAVDDLKSIAQDNLKSREHAATKANDLITAAAKNCIDWADRNEALQSVKMLRQHADTIRDQEVTQALKLLKQGQSPETIINYLARSLTNKLMHHPSLHARAASESGQKDFLDTIHKLFGVTEQ